MSSQTDQPAKNKGGNPILKAGGAAARAHQTLAGMRPRVGKTKATAELSALAAALPDSDEDIDAATLRLQRARADCEELDRQKREIDLAKTRAELITREEAVDLAQTAVQKLCTILDRLPEQLRNLGRPLTPEDVDTAILAMRAEISGVGK